MIKNYLLKSVSIVAIGLFLFAGSLHANVPIEKPDGKNSEAGVAFL